MLKDYDGRKVPVSFSGSDFLPLVNGTLHFLLLAQRVIGKIRVGRDARIATPAGDTVPAFAIIRAAALVLALVVVCDSVAQTIGIPVPGAAVGMILLFAVFKVRNGPDLGTAAIFDRIAPHIPVFFIPAATGIIINLDAFGREWISILLAIVVGTSLALIATGCLMQALLRKRLPEADQ